MEYEARRRAFLVLLTTEALLTTGSERQTRGHAPWGDDAHASVERFDAQLAQGLALFVGTRRARLWQRRAPRELEPVAETLAHVTGSFE